MWASVSNPSAGGRKRARLCKPPGTGTEERPGFWSQPNIAETSTATVQTAIFFTANSLRSPVPTEAIEERFPHRSEAMRPRSSC